MTRARLLALAAALALATGCSMIAGVDFGGVHAKDDGTGLEAGADGSIDPDSGAPAEDGALPPRADGGCAVDEKLCSGTCVKKTDPLFGCTPTSCTACSVPLAATAKCAAGACAPDQCAPGRADCDGIVANGCEADLSAPANCGACTTKCTASLPLCSPTGCVSTCPAGTKLCGATACVDITTSTQNCGDCGIVCPSLANSDPTCAASKCGISCHAGFADCDNNPGNGCEAEGTFYQDGDNDGVGGATMQRACTAPAGYKAKGGDCDDANASVFPGQTAYFGASYVNGAGLASFDYDCDANEVEEATYSSDHFVGTCGVACDNLGYMTAIPFRSGTGVDPYCGSTRYKTCISTLAPVPLGAPLAGGCTQPIGTSAAVTCH